MTAFVLSFSSARYILVYAYLPPSLSLVLFLDHFSVAFFFFHGLRVHAEIQSWRAPTSAGHGTVAARPALVNLIVKEI